MKRNSHVLMAAASVAEAPKSSAPAGVAKTAETKTDAPTTTQSAASPQAAALASPTGAAPVVNAEAATTEAPAAGATVPSTTDPALAAATETRKRAPKDPANTLNIINGRLPLPLVFLIRTKEQGKPTGDVAKRYGTSVGKVFDINKGRNFGYIDANYKPSAEEMAQAENWITTAKTAKGQTLKEAGGDPDGISALLKTLTVASNDEVAKRNWATRVVGAPTGNQAPTAPAGTAPAAATNTTAQPAEKPAGAKLF